MEPQTAPKQTAPPSPKEVQNLSPQAAPDRVLEAYRSQTLDNIPTREKEEAVEQIVQTPKNAGVADAETAETPAGLPYDERVLVEGELICSLIREQFHTCKTTVDMENYLGEICERYHLRSAELVDLGTPDFHVRFQVNPLYRVDPPQGETFIRMVGRDTEDPTRVDWLPGTLQLGSTPMKVGYHMIANPLGPDAEQGSKSTADTSQGSLSEILAYGGTRRENNYIKGHLLNDNAGGPGDYFNLYPITSDANNGHLVAFEKFVKSELDQRHILYYEVEVTNEDVQDEVDTLGNPTGKYIVNARFHCKWSLMDAEHNPIRQMHEGDIVSTFGKPEALPFSIPTEYKGGYNKYDHSKCTPRSIHGKGALGRGKFIVMLPSTHNEPPRLMVYDPMNPSPFVHKKRKWDFPIFDLPFDLSPVPDPTPPELSFPWMDDPDFDLNLADLSFGSDNDLFGMDKEPDSFEF